MNTPFFIVPFLLLIVAMSGLTENAYLETTHHYTAGKTKLTLRKTRFDACASPFLVLLHDDETTAAATATAFLKKNSGTLLSVDNNNNRNLSFLIKNRRHQFDPNRIFTAGGLRQNLQLFGSFTPQAATIVSDFGQFVLRFLPDSVPIIAIHNNTEGRYSVRSYVEDKSVRLDAAAVHINASHDADDFFITTDSVIFRNLQGLNYNCVLQNNTQNSNDGSLSVYFGTTGQRYVNVEAQLGHYDKQLEMLQALHSVLQKMDTAPN